MLAALLERPSIRDCISAESLYSLAQSMDKKENIEPIDRMTIKTLLEIEFRRKVMPKRAQAAHFYNFYSQIN